jgi:hypothetical protein
MVSLLLTACNATAEVAEPKIPVGRVSISIVSAKAELTDFMYQKSWDDKEICWYEDLHADLMVELVNCTGSELQVQSKADGVFDGFTLVILDSQGKELAREAYVDCFFSLHRKGLSVSAGDSTQRLSFMARKKTWGKPESLNVKIVGTFRGTGPGATIESNAVPIMIRDERVIILLVDALENSLAGDAREGAAQALKKLSGQDFGTDHEKWKAWYEENKDK